jgi:hypothetical protein
MTHTLSTTGLRARAAAILAEYLTEHGDKVYLQTRERIELLRRGLGGWVLGSAIHALEAAGKIESRVSGGITILERRAGR